MSTPASPGGPVRRWPGALRAAAYLLSGLLTGLAFEPIGVWPLALIGPALFWWLLHPASGAPEHGPGQAWFRHRGFGPGYLFGLGLCGVVLNWLAALVPVVGPFLAAVLIAFEALFFGALGVLARLLMRAPAWPVGVAAAWACMEWVYGRVPFGGFGWVRLAYAAAEAPVAGLLPFVAVSGTSFAIALVAGLLAHAALPRPGAVGIARWRPVAVSCAAVALLLGAGVAGARWLPEPRGAAGTLRVGMVQGDVDGSGIGGMGPVRSVTRNHVAETGRLMERTRAAGDPPPDFVLWPENATDLDARLDPETRALVTSAVGSARVPILVGSVLEGPGPDERQTAGLWWMPDGSVPARYDKRNLVPFGEYIPFRDQLKPLFPILDLVGAQSVAGERPGLLDVPLADGSRLRVGDVICFEVAYDQTVHEAVRGADVLVVQSNNAAFRGSAQPHQQWAMTRVRAMEARRDVVVATTDSLSGHIDATGRVHDRTREATAASRSYVVPRQSAITPAVRYAGVIDAALGLLTLVWAGLGVSAKRARPAGERAAPCAMMDDEVPPVTPTKEPS